MIHFEPPGQEGSFSSIYIFLAMENITYTVGYYVYGSHHHGRKGGLKT